jgi:hypothetical protein
MSDFQSYPDLAAVDAAQGRMNARGERTYTVDPKYRNHIEAERVRIMSGEPPAEPVKKSLAGVSGVNQIGQQEYLAGEPDPRMLQLANSLSARIGPDGRRMVDSVPGYRERVEASFADAIGGKRWTPTAEKLAADLATEAKNQVADTGLYAGSENQPDLTFDRTDPLFQSAATLADEQGLTDKQFSAVLNFYAGIG